VRTSSLEIGIHDGDEASHFEVFFTIEDLDASLAKLLELGGHAMSEVHSATRACQATQGGREIKAAHVG
jgi:hypothetical protein